MLWVNPVPDYNCLQKKEPGNLVEPQDPEPGNYWNTHRAAFRRTLKNIQTRKKLFENLKILASLVEIRNVSYKKRIA